MTGWQLDYDSFDAGEEPLREALCTLGNGCFATRGAAEEADADGLHYPGTYFAGGYNRLNTEIAGRTIENEDLVNMPNWLPLSFRPQDGEWLDLGRDELLAFRQSLDLQSGVLRRDIRVRDREGRETTLATRRLVSMAEPHVAAIEWRIRPETWSGRLEVRSGLDGAVVNAGVERYRELNGKHLAPIETRQLGPDAILLVVETSQSHLRVAQAARTRFMNAGRPLTVDGALRQEAQSIAQVFSVEAQAGEDIMVEKIVVLFTSRDHAISEPALAAAGAVMAADGFEALLERHARAWSYLWRRCDVVLEGKHRAQLALRLHIFHLLQTVSFNTVDLDVGVPARGLHGEAYRGHIFWDELFIFPFLNVRLPEVTRALLRYRYRRLPAARRLARQAGFSGAMYPWQSGSSGREETQIVHLNPRSGRWLPDHSHLQRHVNIAIAHNVWRYCEATGDAEFMAFYGAEMLVEIARFWASIATWNPERERYEICGVVGPDEFHDGYPWSSEPGLDNNAYTNLMAAWVLQHALAALEQIGSESARELCGTLAVSDEETARWDAVSRRLFVPFHDGVISQFEGYEKLEEFDWEGYRLKYGDIHRLDRILEAEGDTVNRYKASKQADALMLFYLLSAGELADLFERLGYPFEADAIPGMVDYYARRTSHGSTLSRVVTSWVLARADRARSWELLYEALESDIGDIQGGTTKEGIHLGAMAGTVDLVQRGQTGLLIRHDLLHLDPCLPEELGGLRLRIRYRGHWLELDIDRARMRVSTPDGWTGPTKLVVRGTVHDFRPGVALELPCLTEDGVSRPVPL